METNGERPRAPRRGARSLGLVLLSAAILVALLGGFALLLVRDAADRRDALLARFETRAALAGTVVHSFVTDLAARERVQAEYHLSTPVVDQAAFDEVVHSFDLSAAVLLDANGRLLQVAPSKPEILGSDLTLKYAHLKTAVAGRIGVSAVVPSAAKGKPVAAVATPFSTPSGTRVFSGAFSPGSTLLTSYLKGIIPIAGSRAFLLDDSGALLAAASTSGHAHALLAAAHDLRGRYGEFHESGLAYTYVSVEISGAPWRVVLTAPTDGLYAPAQGIAWAAWALWGVLAMTGTLTIVLLVRLRQGRTVATRSAHTDALTGLPNRRAIDELLERESAYARRHHADLGVLMIDIDHFKGVNDTYGHDSGDDVLVDVARTLQSALRTEDVIGRWGGEEFLVTLRAPTTLGAGQLADRLRVAVQDKPIMLGGVTINVTISIGGAVGQDATAVLVRRADEALYVAKRGGRNRVSIDTSDVPRIDELPDDADLAQTR